MQIHHLYWAQLALFIIKKAKIFAQYYIFFYIFSLNSTLDLIKLTCIINHFICLKNDNQSLYTLIYSWMMVKPKTLKTYIESNLASGFLKLLKSWAGAPLFFDCMKNCSPCLYIDYQRLNNFTIKNRYSLSLINNQLDNSGTAKCFNKLDLKNKYHQMQI